MKIETIKKRYENELRCKVAVQEKDYMVYFINKETDEIIAIYEKVWKDRKSLKRNKNLKEVILYQIILKCEIISKKI